MKRIFMAVLLCMVSNLSYASFFDGNRIYSAIKDCEKWEESNGTGAYDEYWSCGLSYGYISGVFESLSGLGEEVENRSVLRFCPPPGVQLGQIVDIVFIYFRDSPEKRSYDAWSSISLALYKAWPCAEE